MAYNKFFFKPALGYKGKVFAFYKSQIEIQRYLLNTIRSALPDSLSSHALFCVASEEKLLLYTDSAIWSSQLRFHQQAILQAILTKNQGDFISIKIKIIPKVIKPKQITEKKLPSTETIDLILAQADSQTDDLLKKSLFKLGQTFQKRSEGKT